MLVAPETLGLRAATALGGDAITQALINRGLYGVAKQLAQGAPQALQYGLTSPWVEGAAEGGHFQRRFMPPARTSRRGKRKSEREFANVLKKYDYFGDSVENYASSMEDITAPTNRTISGECGTGKRLVVTAGTNGQHAPGEHSHAAGWKVDVNDFGFGEDGALTTPDGSKGTQCDGNGSDDFATYNSGNFASDDVRICI